MCDITLNRRVSFLIEFTELIVKLVIDVCLGIIICRT